MKPIRTVVALAALMVAVGCTSDVPHVYTYDLMGALEAPAPSLAASASKLPMTLRVERFNALGGRDRYEMAYSVERNRLDHDHFHRWVERPSRTARAVVLQRLRQSQGFERVEGAGLLDADLILEVELQAFEERLQGPDSKACVTLSGRLIPTASPAQALAVLGKAEVALNSALATADESQVPLARAMEEALLLAADALCAETLDAASQWAAQGPAR